MGIHCLLGTQLLHQSCDLFTNLLLFLTRSRIKANKVCRASKHHLYSSRMELDFGTVKYAVHMFNALKASTIV